MFLICLIIFNLIKNKFYKNNDILYKNDLFEIVNFNKNYILFNSEYIFNIANNLFDKKKYDKSIYYYSLIIKYHCKSKFFLKSLMQIANIFKIKKDYKKAILMYEQVSIIDSSNIYSKKAINELLKLKNINNKKNLN